jgi:hypothetical protein
MVFSRNIQLMRDPVTHDAHSSQTMTIYRLILPVLCQHMYVCVQALVHVKAAHAHVKPRRNVARSTAIVARFLQAAAIQALGRFCAEKHDPG